MELSIELNKCSNILKTYTIKLINYGKNNVNGLGNLQARVIFEELENNWDFYNVLLKEQEIQQIDLEDSNGVKTNEDGDTNYSIVFCASEIEDRR